MFFPTRTLPTMTTHAPLRPSSVLRHREEER